MIQRLTRYNILTNINSVSGKLAVARGEKRVGERYARRKKMMISDKKTRTREEPTRESLTSAVKGAANRDN